MKTLLVVPWDEERGGVVAVAENLARYFKAQGDTVLFLHPGLPVILKTRKTRAGFTGVLLRLGFPLSSPRRVLSTLMFPFLFPFVLVQLLWFLRKHRIEVVNLHFLNQRFFYFGICRWLLSIKLVASIHGSDAFQNGKARPKYSRAFRFLVRSSDLVILPSNAYRTKFVEVFPFARHKTIFIHNGIDASQFRVARNVTGSGPHHRYILCIAALAEWKGVDVLLDAVAKILLADESLNLVIVGDGVMRQRLEAMAASLGISRRTRFLGALPGGEVAQLLQGCELLVVPSRAESFGIVVLEGMICKKPVIASAVGGIPEIIEHEISGILVEPDNPQALSEQIQRVLNDGDLRKRLAENGHSRVVERFCFSQTGAAYKTAFASLMVGAGGSLKQRDVGLPDTQ